MMDRLGDLERWLQANNTRLDEITVWTVAVCFALCAVAGVVVVLMLRDTRDRTDVGRYLKRKKLAEAIKDATMAGLYGLTLFAFYASYRISVWPKFALRVVLVLALLSAAFWGVRFALALRAERRRGDAPGAA